MLHPLSPLPLPPGYLLRPHRARTACGSVVFLVIDCTRSKLEVDARSTKGRRATRTLCFYLGKISTVRLHHTNAVFTKTTRTPYGATSFSLPFTWCIRCPSGCHCTRLSLPCLRPSDTSAPYPPTLPTLQPPHRTTMTSKGVPSRPTRTHTLPAAPGGVSPSPARPSRGARARGGRVAARAASRLVIVRGRQPSAGRRAGQLSPAARAPRRGCSAPCAS